MTDPVNPNTQRPVHARDHVCPSDEELLLWAGGKSSRDLTAHLEWCTTCRQIVLRQRHNEAFLEGFSGMLKGEAPAESKPSPPSPSTATAATTPPISELSVNNPAPPSSSYGPSAALPSRFGEFPRVPGYELIREIHRGGQGVVYEANQQDPPRRVALKLVLHGGFASDSERRRLLREADLVGLLRHPNIVAVYDSLTLPDGGVGIALEFIEGERLNRWAEGLDTKAKEKSGPTTLRSAQLAKVRAVAAIAQAVHYAHQRAIIHRDLKPANILAGSDDQPHVLDFGIARHTGVAIDPAARITLDGQFAGTLAYASPEQLSGSADQIDTRSDVYSLGVILFELLVGAMPYPVDGSIRAVMEHIRTTEPIFPKTPGRVLGSRAPIDDDMVALLRRALAKEPAGRYQSAEALAADLANWISGAALDARRSDRWYLFRKFIAQRRVAVVAAGMVVVAVTAAVVTRTQFNRLARQSAAASRAREVLDTVALARQDCAAGREGAAGARLARKLDELLISGAEPGNGFKGEPSILKLYWALGELDHAHPCLAQWQTSTPTVLLGIDSNALAVEGYQQHRLTYWTLDGRTISEQLQGSFPNAIEIVAPIGGTVHGFRSGRQVWFFRDRSGIVGRDLDDRDGVFRHFGISHDGARIAGVSERGHLTLYSMMADATSPPRSIGDPLLTDACPDCSPVFSPDDRQVVAWTRDGSLSLVDIESHTVRSLARADQPPAGSPPPVFTRSGNALLAACGRTLYSLKFSPTIQAQQNSLNGPGTATVSALAVSPSGSTFAVGFADGTTTTGSFLDLKERDDLPAPEQPLPVTSLCFSADESLLGTVNSGSRQSAVRLWVVQPTRPSWQCAPGAKSFVSAAISTDGLVAAVDSGTGGIELFHVSGATSRRTARLGSLSGPIAAIAFSADGRFVAAGNAAGQIQHWDRPALTTPDLQPWSDRGGPITALRFSPDSRSLAWANQGPRVFVRSFDTGLVRALDVGNTFTGTRLSLDFLRGLPGSQSSEFWLGLVSDSGSCILLDPAGTRPPRVLIESGPPLRAVACHPTRPILAIAGDNQTVALVDAASGSVTPLPSFTESTVALAFHRNGRILAAGGQNGTVRLWDVDDPRFHLADLHVDETTTSLAFSENNLLVVARTGARLLDLDGLSHRIAAAVGFQHDRSLRTATIGAP